MIASTFFKQKQKTIKNEISFSGIGLHSGIKSQVTIKPSEVNSGINFFRTDVSDLNNNALIMALWHNVSSTTLSTTISNGEVSVSTIEHLMSALSGMHIDNALILIDGPEVPIMDGSSKPFVELFENAGVIKQDEYRKVLKVMKEVAVSSGDSSVKILPSDYFSIDFEIVFDSPLINRQSCHLQLMNGNYKSDIASARTFGFEREVLGLRERGYALGGCLENAVVVGDNNILNKDGLRFEDEFVRHKMLDSIGDLYLAGYPVQGYFSGKKSGHYLNNQLLSKLLSDHTNFEII